MATVAAGLQGLVRHARPTGLVGLGVLAGVVLAALLAPLSGYDVATGVDPGTADLAGLRYGKIIILADADSDGAHIATLICALFLRHFRPLVAAGHVYVAQPPLYRIDVGKEVFYALDEAERRSLLRRIEGEPRRRGKATVTRFKGLGEMSPLQLRETTMAPDTRRLLQLTIDDTPQADTLMDMLLAKKRAADRRQWLETHGDKAKVGNE